VAEKEAWRLAKEHGIDLVVVNPSFVIGPALGPRPTSTILIVLAMLKGRLCVLFVWAGLAYKSWLKVLLSDLV